jgi:catechol 2,3-dioxygenase-like lactoylglutathione lyase family enzyme
MSNPDRPMTCGVHHLALVTDDMRRTVDFYVDVLGMPLVHAMKVPPGLGTGPGNRGNPPYESIRHYFFDMGGNGLIAFFEVPANAEPKAGRNHVGGMQHCAFIVPEARFRAVEARLREHGVDYIGPIPQLPGLLGIYFYDPNGIRLELACQPADGDDIDVVRCVRQTKAEARAELATLSGVDERWLRARTEDLPD